VCSCVGDVAGEGRLGKKEAAETRFSEKKSIFASGGKNGTIRTKTKFMSISGSISFVDVAGVSTRSTYFSCTYPNSSILYIRDVSTAFYLFFWRTLVSSTNSTSVLRRYVRYYYLTYVFRSRKLYCKDRSTCSFENPSV
jgi:hypothetical protein